MKLCYSVENQNGIELYMRHTQVETISAAEGRHPGDDEIALTIDRPEDYDSDLIQNGVMMLHFNKAQAKKLARQLLRMAQNLCTAEERAEARSNERIIIPTELLDKVR